MKRNFGAPGRIDLAEIHAPPSGGRLPALAGFLALAVILLGLAMLAAVALYQIGVRAQLGVLVHGG